MCGARLRHSLVVQLSVGVQILSSLFLQVTPPIQLCGFGSVMYVLLNLNTVHVQGLITLCTPLRMARLKMLQICFPVGVDAVCAAFQFCLKTAPKFTWGFYLSLISMQWLPRAFSSTGIDCLLRFPTFAWLLPNADHFLFDVMGVCVPRNTAVPVTSLGFSCDFSPVANKQYHIVIPLGVHLPYGRRERRGATIIHIFGSCYKRWFIPQVPVLFFQQHRCSLFREVAVRRAFRVYHMSSSFASNTRIRVPLIHAFR